MKNKAIPTQSFVFSGEIVDGLSTLSQELPDIYFAPFMTYHNPLIQMLIDTDKDDKSTVSLKLLGDLEIAIEENRNITLKTFTEFDKEDPTYMGLKGLMIGIYENIFGINHLIDILSLGLVNAVPALEEIPGLNLTTISLLGHGCYTNQTYFDAMTKQAIGKTDSIAYSYKNTDTELSAFVNDKKCIVGELYLYISKDFSQNNIRAQYGFRTVERLLSVVLDAKLGDTLPNLARNITFESDMVLSVNYTEYKAQAEESKSLTFAGAMSLYGIDATGEIVCNIKTNVANLVMHLPNFSMGSGNVQFLSSKTIAKYLGLSDDQNVADEVKKYSDGADVSTEENTLKIEMKIGSLSSSKVTLNANVLMFELVHRISIDISDQEISFPLSGKPFGGIFQADTFVRVKPVKDLQKEGNSVVTITLKMDDTINQLQKETNDVLKRWIDEIIETFTSISNAEKMLIESKSSLQNQYFDVSTCKQYSRCVDTPVLECKKFNTERVCTQTKLTCDTIQYKCVEQNQH